MNGDLTLLIDAARRAGATATDRHGGPLFFKRPAPRTASCITATPVIHGALLERLLPWKIAVPNAGVVLMRICCQRISDLLHPGMR